MSANFKKAVISIPLILVLTACDRQGATESADAAPTMPVGNYSNYEAGKKAFTGITYYSDGAFIQMNLLADNPNAGPMIVGINVGRCHVSGGQIDCKQTGASTFPNISSFNPINVEFSELIRTSADGDISTKRIKTVVNGQQKEVDGKWSSKLHRIKTATENEDNARTRQGVPPQFFIAN